MNKKYLEVGLLSISINYEYLENRNYGVYFVIVLSNTTYVIKRLN